MQAKYSVVTYPGWEPHLFLKLKYRRQEKKKRNRSNQIMPSEKKFLFPFLHLMYMSLPSFPSVLQFLVKERDGLRLCVDDWRSRVTLAGSLYNPAAKSFTDAAGTFSAAQAPGIHLCVCENSRVGRKLVHTPTPMMTSYRQTHLH